MVCVYSIKGVGANVRYGWMSFHLSLQGGERCINVFHHG